MSLFPPAIGNIRKKHLSIYLTISFYFPGSDIGGSIRMPCYFNGIFGHKPSKYVVSIKGQYPQPSTDMQRSFLGKIFYILLRTGILGLLKLISNKYKIIEFIIFVQVLDL